RQGFGSCSGRSSPGGRGDESTFEKHTPVENAVGGGAFRLPLLAVSVLAHFLLRFGLVGDRWSLCTLAVRHDGGVEFCPLDQGVGQDGVAEIRALEIGAAQVR